MPILVLKRAFTHRFIIAGTNAFLLFITVSVILEMVGQIPHFPETQHAVERLSEQLATLFIGYGVVVEERGFLMRILRLYPAMESDREEAIDHVCHSHGFGYLVLGLLMEMVAQLIELPNTIVNTDGNEHTLMWICAGLASLAAVLLVHHLWRMLFVPVLQSQATEGHCPRTVAFTDQAT